MNYKDILQKIHYFRAVALFGANQNLKKQDAVFSLTDNDNLGLLHFAKDKFIKSESFLLIFNWFLKNYFLKDLKSFETHCLKYKNEESYKKLINFPEANNLKEFYLILIANKEDKIVEEIKKRLVYEFLISPIYFPNKNHLNETRKTNKDSGLIPIYFWVKIDFSKFMLDLYDLIPLDIPKVSNSCLLFHQKEELYSPLILTTFEDYDNHLVGRGREDIFEGDKIIDFNKWNSLIHYLDTLVKNPCKKEDTYSEVISNTIMLFEVKDNISVVKNYNKIINSLTHYEKHPDKSNYINRLSLFEQYLQKNNDISSNSIDQEVLLNNLFLKDTNKFSGQLTFNCLKDKLYGLNINQQIFVDNIINNNENFLVLNGPPGTGKTTVLQTSLASLVVKAFLDKKENPPVIIGMSATNQAKNNIIDGFKYNKLKDQNDPNFHASILFDRWISPIKYDGDNITLDYGMPLNRTFKKEGICLENIIKQLLDEGYLNASLQIYKDKEKQFFNTFNLSCFSSLLYLFELNLNPQIATPKDLYSLARFLEKEILSPCEEKKLLVVQVLLEYLKIPSLESSLTYENQQLDIQINEIAVKKQEIITVETITENYQKAYRKWLSHEKTKGFFAKIFDNVGENKLTIMEINKEFSISINLEKYDSKSINNLFSILIDENHIDNKISKAKTKLIGELKVLEKNSSAISKKISTTKELIESYLVNYEKIKREMLLKLKHLNNQEPYLNYSILIKEIETEISEKTIENVYVGLSYIIDNFMKPVLFNMAMRHYENLYLKEAMSLIHDEKFIRNDGLIKQTKLAVEKKYNLLSKIFPCFVSTMHSALKNFNYFDYFNKLEWPMLGFIDYLVVDESGQCSPEIGAIAFMLSKKAIVVGDTYQIAPVWAVEENQDFRLFAHYLKAIKSPEEVYNYPFNCHAGSVMKIAQNSTKTWQYPELEKGLYLLEHRRCPNEIIQYCNELIYKKKLILLPESSFNKIKKENLYLENQKAWNFIPSDGICEMHGSSRYNEKEAQQIVEFLKKNYSLLTKNETEKIEDVVAILSPFKIQADNIKKIINKVVPEAKEITCGTVHSLQGAEKKIILLSFVYDHSSVNTELFIDRNPSIINVGVSRAKQSIYVFANQEVLQKAKGRATKLLWAYLQTNGEHINVN